VKAVDWGPVGVWVGATATFLAALVALLASVRGFDRFRSARLRVTFQQQEPWCRRGDRSDGGHVLWVRVGVENVGRQPARGCVGRMIGVSTDGVRRADIDPIQLRWAGVPRSRSFDAVDIRRGQREFVNVLCLRERSVWQIVTFEDDDFDPGFTTELAGDQHHVLQLAVFADNAEGVASALAVDVVAHETSAALRLVDAN